MSFNGKSNRRTAVFLYTSNLMQKHEEEQKKEFHDIRTFKILESLNPSEAPDDIVRGSSSKTMDNFAQHVSRARLGCKLIFWCEIAGALLSFQCGIRDTTTSQRRDVKIGQLCDRDGEKREQVDGGGGASPRIHHYLAMGIEYQMEDRRRLHISRLYY